MCACEECTITTKKISNSYQQCVPRYKLNGKRNSIGKYNQLGKFIHKLLKRGKKERTNLTGNGSNILNKFGI